MSSAVLTFRSCDPDVASCDEASEHRDKITVATEKAINDLINFIGHVVNLISDDFPAASDVMQWLEDLELRVGDISDAMEEDELWAGRESRESEELENLELLLEEMPTLEEAKEFEKIPESCGRELLVRLTDFWLEEVSARGYVVHSLLQGSGDCWSVDAALSALAKVNYPPNYMR